MDPRIAYIKRCEEAHGISAGVKLNTIRKCDGRRCHEVMCVDERLVAESTIEKRITERKVIE